MIILSPSAGNPVGRGWGHYLFSLSDRSSQIQALIYVYIIYIYHDLSYLSGSFFDLACQLILLIIIHSKPIQLPAQHEVVLHYYHRSGRFGCCLSPGHLES